MLFPPLNPPPPTIFDVLGNYLLLAAGIVVFLFAVVYFTFFGWRKTPGGKAIMYFVTGLVALLLHSIATRFLAGDFPYRDVLRAVVYAYLLITASGLLLNLVLTWRRGNYSRMLPPWRERALAWQERHAEAKAVRVRHRAQRRALRWEQQRERWGSEDDQAVADAADAHQEDGDRSSPSSSSTSG